MKRLVVLMLAGLLTMLTPEAKAEGFALYEWGARGSALANGMVGRADDASAVAHNPAGITQLAGGQVMAGLAFISPKMLIDTVAGGVTTTTRVNRHYYTIPHGFYTQQLSDSVWFGFGMFTRYGLGNQYEDNWPGQANLQDVKLTTLSLNPNLAFKVTDSLSLAVGLEGQVARMIMHRNTPLGYMELRGKNTLGVGVNLAMHYKFNEQWAAGFSYRSAINHKVKGKNKFYNSMYGSLLDGSLKGTLRTPDSFTAGVTYKPMDNLSFEVGGVYTVWSKFRNFNITFNNPLLAATGAGASHKNWRDTWLFNISVEYLPLDWMALRAGFSYETSPIPAGTADYMVETNGRRRYSCGVGFMWENWTLDLAYTMLRSRELDYNSSTAAGVLPGKSHHGITHVGSFSVGYKF